MLGFAATASRPKAPLAIKRKILAGSLPPAIKKFTTAASPSNVPTKKPVNTSENVCQVSFEGKIGYAPYGFVLFLIKVLK